MVRIKAKVNNKSGLHARPAGAFISEAKKFKSDIKIHNGSKSGNGKSIISLIGLTIKGESFIEIEANGDDEVAAAEALKVFLEEKISD